MLVQVWPPSMLVPSTRLREPPVVQRSSCHMPTTLSWFDWLIETIGSVCESSVTLPLVVSSSAVNGPETPWSVDTRTTESTDTAGTWIVAPATVAELPETPAENRAPWKVRPSGPRAAAGAAGKAAANATRAAPATSRFTGSSSASSDTSRPAEHPTRSLHCPPPAPARTRPPDEAAVSCRGAPQLRGRRLHPHRQRACAHVRVGRPARPRQRERARRQGLGRAGW